MVRWISHFKDRDPHCSPLHSWQEAVQHQGDSFFCLLPTFIMDIKPCFKVIVGENDISDEEQMKLEVAEVLIHLQLQ